MVFSIPRILQLLLRCAVLAAGAFARGRRAMAVAAAALCIGEHRLPRRAAIALSELHCLWLLRGAPLPRRALLLLLCAARAAAAAAASAAATPPGKRVGLPHDEVYTPMDLGSRVVCV